MVDCNECNTTGEQEIDVPVRQSATNPYGYIDTKTVPCEHCNGTGKVDNDD